MDSFRKAYGALKDSTKVGLAKVNSDFKDLDIAIVKATNHVECPPKERHVARIFAAVSVPSPRADVGYCIHALSKRLSNTHSWIVAIKSLIVFHRILREGDATFRQELMHISTRGHVLHSSDFKDDSTTLAWDCSGFVRSYALYLEERLECFRSLNCEMKPEDRRLTNKSGSRETKEHSKNGVLNNDQLLEELPVLQQLLYRLVCCQPEGAARNNYLVQYALALVVKESFKVYCRINDLMIVLVDTYFDMPKEKAVAALAIYKKAGRQADHLAGFYDLCTTLDLAQSFHFPILRQPPSTFVATMEDYIEKAPERVSLSCQMKIEHEKRGEETAEIGEEKAVSEAMQAQQPVDLLGLNEASPKPEETNALALAICEPVIQGAANDQPQTEASPGSGWELALVTAPSSTGSHHQAGGFDRLLLDSLYDDAAARRQLELHRAGYSTHGYGYGYGYETRPQNLFVQNGEPFAYVEPASERQMTMMSLQQQQQQQQQWQQYQMMTMAPINQPTPYASQNPFGDPFGYPQSSMPMPKPPHGNPTLF